MKVAQILTPDLLKIISTNLSEPKNVQTESFSKIFLKTLNVKSFEKNQNACANKLESF